MLLTPEQQAMLNGEKGETMAKVVKTLVMYGETFGAKRMVPITSKYGHTVISFGLKVMKPVYDLYQEIIDAGLTADQKFTADPKPLDKHVPSSLIEDLVFKKFMYTVQDDYEKQLVQLGITNDDDYTCTCYLDQVGNKPNKGDILSWAESSAVVYANSVLGARCNRNSGMIELMGSIAGFVPEFGLLLDEERKATWIVEVKCEHKPEAQLLGSAIGMKVMEEVPYVKGLDKWLGTELDEEACAYLKDFGAATASNGAVGLYHIENLTPEAVEQGEGISLVLRRAVGLLEVERADKVMAHAGLLLGRGGRRADGELAIELAGVGVEDGTTEALCLAQGVGGLADTRGAEDDLKGLFHGGKGGMEKKEVEAPRPDGGFSASTVRSGCSASGSGRTVRRDGHH